MASKFKTSSYSVRKMTQSMEKHLRSKRLNIVPQCKLSRSQKYFPMASIGWLKRLDCWKRLSFENMIYTCLINRPIYFLYELEVETLFP